MPTPAWRAMARRDACASVEANTRVAASISSSRLWAASARVDRGSGSGKRITLRLSWMLHPEHSPFRCGSTRARRRARMQQHSESPPDRTSRAVQLESFGGPDVLTVRDVPEPRAGEGQIRVRVTAAGLNPMDWVMTADAETAARFGLSLPCGVGTDYAGVVEQVGAGVTGFAVGDRVFGGALSRGVADHVVVDVAGTIAVGGEAHRTPDGV